VASKASVQANQAVFGSVQGKRQTNADAQIQREIKRLETQMQKQTTAQQHVVDSTVRALGKRAPAVKVKGAKTIPTANGPAFHSNGSAYHRYP
jgi:hypothetical protein